MVKVAAGPVPGEGPLPGLQTAAFSLRPRMAERELWPLLIKTVTPL